MEAEMKSGSGLRKSDLRVQARAISMHAMRSNRIWLSLAALSLLSLGITTADDTMAVFGLQLSTSLAILLLPAIIALGNVAFCSAYAQVFHSYKIYSDMITNDISGKSADQAQEYRRVAHGLYLPAISRVYPIFMGKSDSATTDIVAAWAKFGADLIIFFVPLVGLAGTLASAFDVWWARANGWIYLALGILLVVALASSLASLVSILQAGRWAAKVTTDRLASGRQSPE
jgi:hypothetical protein